LALTLIIISLAPARTRLLATHRVIHLTGFWLLVVVVVVPAHQGRVVAVPAA
jgi:hypothetical protein